MPSISGFHNTGVNKSIGAIKAFIVGSISLYLADKIPTIPLYKEAFIKTIRIPNGRVNIALWLTSTPRTIIRMKISGK